MDLPEGFLGISKIKRNRFKRLFFETELKLDFLVLPAVRLVYEVEGVQNEVLFVKLYSRSNAVVFRMGKGGHDAAKYNKCNEELLFKFHGRCGLLHPIV